MSSVRELVHRIRAIERRGSDGAAQPDDYAARGGDRVTLCTGWAAIDAHLGGGLPVGALHEWFGVARPRSTGNRPDGDSRGRWSPPIAPLVHLARQHFNAAAQHARLAWIGRSCFPYPHVLAGDLLARSLFIAPANTASRVWAIDLALRSPAVGLVIADGSALNMAATRRIHLVARHFGKPAFLVRPAWERGELSAAQTRWLIRWEPSVRQWDGVAVAPRWSVQLLRCKGVQPASVHGAWTLEGNRAQGVVCVPAPLADPARAAEAIAQTAGRSRQKTA